jgi:hypothetical protein
MIYFLFILLHTEGSFKGLDVQDESASSEFDFDDDSVRLLSFSFAPDNPFGQSLLFSASIASLISLD